MHRSALYIVAILLFSVQAFAGEKAKDITPAQAQQMIESGKYFVLDVRTDKEYRSGHLVNAVLVDYYKTDFLENLLKLDKEKPVIVYCARGRRSSAAVDMMVNNGFKKVYNVLGGFEGWTAESLPSVR
ncbi:MAG: rhodanese-like domain-containing protein [bacterium]|nr:rhodanese-like domain-containing protein [bacterium]